MSLYGLCVAALHRSFLTFIRRYNIYFRKNSQSHLCCADLRRDSVVGMVDYLPCLKRNFQAWQSRGTPWTRRGDASCLLVRYYTSGVIVLMSGDQTAVVSGGTRRS